MFFHVRFLPFVSILENNWRVIRGELDSLEEGGFRPWREKHIYDRDWTILVLFDGYKRYQARKVEDNCRVFPETTNILENIPGLLTAGFSRLGPNTRIKPHKGCDSTVLRVHLGLQVPERCGLRVRGQTRNWMEGACLAFDDTYIHQAWNLSSKPRTILLIDVILGGPPPIVLRDAIQPLWPGEAIQWAGQWLSYLGRRLCA